MSLLRLDGVSRNFGGVQAVDDCTFEVAEGSLTGLIGPNGAGKSTVFNLISGLMAPADGKIIFDGKSIGGRRPEEIANMGLGRTFQTPHAFLRLTVLDNICASAPNRGDRMGSALSGSWRSEEADLEQRARGLLDRVGLGGRANVSADLLSGGELRMLEVARQLIREPRILLLDEPTAGLDPALQDRLAELLRVLNQDGVTLLVVEHNLGFLLSLAERIVVMAAGTVLAEGTPEQIRSDEAVVTAYLGQRHAP